MPGLCIQPVCRDTFPARKVARPDHEVSLACRYWLTSLGISRVRYFPSLSSSTIAYTGSKCFPAPRQGSRQPSRSRHTPRYAIRLRPLGLRLRLSPGPLNRRQPRSRGRGGYFFASRTSLPDKTARCCRKGEQPRHAYPGELLADRPLPLENACLPAGENRPPVG